MGPKDKRGVAKTLQKVAGVTEGIGTEILKKNPIGGVIKRREQGVEITITPKAKPM